MGFRKGDRVRIVSPNSEYTGCRGTISDSGAEPSARVRVLGHEVAIDGENGVTRPFLIDDLQPIKAVQVRRPSQTKGSGNLDAGASKNGSTMKP